MAVRSRPVALRVVARLRLWTMGRLHIRSSYPVAYMDPILIEAPPRADREILHVVPLSQTGTEHKWYY